MKRAALVALCILATGCGDAARKRLAYMDELWEMQKAQCLETGGVPVRYSHVGQMRECIYPPHREPEQDTAVYDYESPTY